MRTLKQIERELTEAQAIASAKDLGPTLDNDGRLVYTADQRRARARDKAAQLQAELDLPFWRSVRATRES